VVALTSCLVMKMVMVESKVHNKGNRSFKQSFGSPKIPVKTSSLHVHEGEMKDNLICLTLLLTKE